MRTLDEVIKAVEEDLECANVSYPEVFYDYDNHKDALYYLKEYKIKRERVMVKAQDCEDAEKHLQDEIAVYKEILTDYVALKQYWAEQQANNPLTMEYFSKQIDTEPIWCEKLGEWYLFLAYDDGENEIQLMSDKGDIETFDEEDLEEYPLYRRKNEKD